MIGRQPEAKTKARGSKTTKTELGRSKQASIGSRRHGGARAATAWVRGRHGGQCLPPMAMRNDGGGAGRSQALGSARAHQLLQRTAVASVGTARTGKRASPDVGTGEAATRTGSGSGGAMPLVAATVVARATAQAAAVVLRRHKWPWRSFGGTGAVGETGVGGGGLPKAGGGPRRRQEAVVVRVKNTLSIALAGADYSGGQGSCRKTGRGRRGGSKDTSSTKGPLAKTARKRRKTEREEAATISTRQGGRRRQRRTGERQEEMEARLREARARVE